jgi:ABC-2 type transport system permease protein
LKKLWHVFISEYVRRVKTKGFVFAVISMPSIVILAMVLGVVSVIMQSSTLPIGYLDQSGIFSSAAIPTDFNSFPVKPIDMIRYVDLGKGQNDVIEEKIQAFFVIEPNYLETGSVDAYVKNNPGENAFDRMRGFLRENLISGEPDIITQRIEHGSNFTVKAFDGSREANMRDWFVIMFPFMIGLIFVIVINISGGYLLQSVVDEKENRTMELIVTSISPEQLMIGKIMGNLCVGLTQLLIWVLFAVLGMVGVQLIFHYGQPMMFQPIHFLLLAGIILPGFVLIAALMTMVGVTATELHEAQQVSILFTLPMVSPFWFAGAVLQHPQNPLTTFLSIFPFTAVVTMPLRISIAAVPSWQLALAVAAMWGSAILALLLAAKAFRLGMLSYGKRIKIKEIFSRRLAHG